MKNYKVNTDHEPLNEADIARGKNFNEVLKNYRALKTPFFKTTKFWGSASALVVASIASIVMYNKMAGFDNVNGQSQPFINPPVAQADIPATKYVVHTGTDSTIRHFTGSLIHVPANAFVDANGKIVTGDVELSYREFKKVSEVFLAGIPMTYDSAGEQYHFESAGMMELGASQNGKSLLSNPNAPITVDMVSAQKEDRFNTYYLDTVEKKWKYQSQSNYIVTTERSDTPVTNTIAETPELKTVKEEIAKIERHKPVEPKKLDNTKPKFTIKVDEKEFPEVAIYNNVKFQAADDSYDPSKADIEWNNIEMKKVDGTKNYEITFSNFKQSYSVIATPVFAEQDYADAKDIYEKKYAEYQNKLAKRKADEAKLLADMDAKAKDATERIRKEMQEIEARRKEYEARLQQSNLVYRTFMVNSFGIWNCDCPSRLPMEASVVATIMDAKTKKPLQIQTCYLVEKGRNMMYTYTPGSLGNFRFNPGAENMVWAVTSDLKVAVMKPEQFKAAMGGGKQMQLELNVIDNKFKSSSEVQEYLEI